MALTQQQIATSLGIFFESVENAVVDDATEKALPLIGAVSALPGAAAISDAFEMLRAKLLAAIASVDPDALPDLAMAIVDAINTLALTGVSASKNAGGGIDLNVAEQASITTGPATIDTGDLGFLKFEATTGATIAAALNAALSFSTDGKFSIKDQVAPELSIDVSADFSLNAVKADIGVVKALITDADPLAPELSAHFGLDLSSDSAGLITVTPTTTVDAKLDLAFKSSDVLFGLLPNISGHLVVDYPISDDPAAGPTVTVDQVKLDLKSYLDIVGDTAQEVGNVFNAGPLGKLVDIAIAPIPVLDSIAHLIPGLLHLFDQVGSLTGGGDGVVSLGDLAVGMQPSSKEFIGPFYQVLAIIDVLRTLDKLGDLGEIDIGGGARAADGTLTSNTDAGAVLDALKAKLGTIADDVLPQAVKDFLTDFNTTDALKALDVGNSNGFTFGLLEDPSKILDILFTNKPVNLVEFDVPKLSLGTQFSKFFPVLGPLGFELGGKLNASIDVNVGYDTGGLITGQIEDGFYFSTAFDPNPKPGLPYAPAGDLSTGLFGGGGASFGFGEATVRAEFNFGVSAYFSDADGDGKFRPGVDSLGCIFSPIKGTAGIEVYLHFKIGFGVFSFTKNIPLAEINLANFDIFTCPPPTVESTPTAPGLATVIGSDIFLNVGDRASDRKIADNETGEVHNVANVDDASTPDVDEGLNEGYVIGLARDTVSSGTTGAGSATMLVDGMLDITAFGVTQRVSANGVIRADFKDGADELVLQEDVTTRAEVHGGGGRDLLVGARGDDILYGDDGEDVLAGHDGNDKLYGGKDADQLSGGKGADLLDGGDGTDTADYSQANRDVAVGITISLVGGAFTSSGGEANGDVLVSIENVVGTDYNDKISAKGANFQVYLEGGAGNDSLYGGNAKDFLQGGAGGDLMNGGGDEDATTYIYSWAGIDVDLNRIFQHGGDAEGDILINIEDIQGTVFDDHIVGNALNNIFDGGAGNDRLDGGAGHDEIYGGDGDDTVWGRADGDLLNGGYGTNLLTYTLSTKAVDVNLGTSQDKDGKFQNAPDSIVMIRPASDTAAGISTFANLIGSRFADRLVGDVNANRIEGGDGADEIRGGDGFDHLVGGSGADVLDGGSGIDWVEYQDSASAVQVDLLAAGLGGSAAGDTFTISFATFSPTVENILGSDYGDTLRGSNADNVIDPAISGRAVNEIVEGRGGIDTLRVDYSSAAADVGGGVTGGFSGATSGTLVHADGEGGTTVTFTTIERLDFVGTRFDDTVVGGAYDDRIVSGAGDDTIYAGLGADYVRAGRGSDGVGYGFLVNGGSAVSAGLQPFFLDGGTGGSLFGGATDSLSILIGASTEDLTVTGGDESGEFTGYNVRMANGAAAVNFEQLVAVLTGSGNDRITQLGQVDNYFVSGDGDDVIRPGLGRDVVDGGLNTDGLGPVGVDANQRPLAQIKDYNALVTTPGDLLVLDYSSLGADQRVISSTTSVFSLRAQAESVVALIRYEVDTNSGRYVTLDTTRYGDSGIPKGLPESFENDVSFTNIERLNVIGSNQNDIIAGTDRAMASLAGPGSELEPPTSVTGADVLFGAGGDDLLFGKSGNDLLNGGDGDDVLQGATVTPMRGVEVSNTSKAPAYDPFEVDTLTGGRGADTFVLGTIDGVLYELNTADGGAYNDPGRAIITDFTPDEGDVIQLAGKSQQYLLQETDTGTLIFYRSTTNRLANDLIGEVQGVFGLDLSSDAFSYVGGTAQALVASRATDVSSIDLADSLLQGSATSATAPAPDLKAMLSAAVTQPEATSPSVAAAKVITPIVSLAEPFTVTQQSDASALKATLDAAIGATATSLSLTGTAEAFGTFTGDPFGLGKGIILSTGRAVDLPGVNTSESGGSNVTSVPVTFVKIGTSDGNTIFRADLSGLNIDLRSLRLTDSGSAEGGSGGEASGFDLAAIALSTKFIADVTGLHLDDVATLPKLDVFDFSSATVTFDPGSQRAPNNTTYNYQENLLGAVNTTLFDESEVRLDRFLPSPGSANIYGSLTLGDGGSIGFDLTQPVSTAGPLYLYISEVGANGETAIGSVQVSGDTVAPTGDLSTDLGAPGLAGDDTALTYHFTPKAGDTGFAMNVVLFSEEIPEFDGTSLTDLFSIKLNGIEIGALNNGNELSIKALSLSPNTDIVFNDVGTGPLADQIKADAYTKVLRISGTVLQGSDNVLTIEAKDGRDAYLDSGLLIQTDTFHTFVKPMLTVSVDGGGAAPGGILGVVLTLPPGSNPAGTTSVVLTPSGEIDLGNGPGGAVTVTFPPGGPLSVDVPGTVAPGADPANDGTISVTITSDDPDLNGAPVAPIVVDVLPPVVVTDPFLIFERLSGDVLVGLTNGNDIIDVTGRPGPTTLHVVGATSGKDMVKGLGSNDILVVDAKIFDGNNDGIITFGKNKVLDLDGPDAGKDTIAFNGGPNALRLLGTDNAGHWVYADAAVRPKGAAEGTFADTMFAGDAGDKKQNIFFFDTNLDVNWGHDTIKNFGQKDVLITTSKLYDADNDGEIALGANGKLALNGSSFFDVGHGGNVADTAPFGTVDLFGTSGLAITNLTFDGTLQSGGNTYYLYGT